MILYHLIFKGEADVLANDRLEAMDYLSYNLDLLDKRSFIDFDKITICSDAIVNNKE